MNKDKLKNAVVEAARKVVYAPICREPTKEILALADALAAFDAHTAQEVVTLAVWSVNAGQSVRFAVAGAEDDRPDAAWENRLGTVTLPLDREDGR